MNHNVPKYVKLVNGRWIFRPYIKKAKRHLYEVDKYGYLKPIKLGVKGDQWHVIMASYARALKQVSTIEDPNKFTLFWVNDRYKNSTKFKSLKPNTQRQNSFSEKVLNHPTQINGEMQRFGNLHFKNLTAPRISLLLEKRLSLKQEQGFDGRSVINRERAYLSALITFGISKYDDIGLTHNPCEFVEKKRENVRKTYIDDERYQVQYDFLLNNGFPEYVAIYHELAFLLLARGVEVRKLRVKDCKEDGILVKRAKGSTPTTILWSDRLRAAYKAAIDLHRETPIGNAYLLINTKYKPVSESAIQQQMQTLREKMTKADIGDQFFHMHDMVRKGQSEVEDKNASGKSESMQKRYSVKTQKYKPPA